MSKKKYFEIHSRDLAQVLGGELSGSFEKLIITALQANQETFDPDYHTEAKMKEDVERLYKMGQGIYMACEMYLSMCIGYFFWPTNVAVVCIISNQVNGVRMRHPCSNSFVQHHLNI